MNKNNNKTTILHSQVKRITSLHFLYVLALAIQLIVYDAGKLIAPEMTLKRWLSIGALLIINAVVWYIARNRSGKPSTLKWAIFMLVISDIMIASFNVYTQRGMASKGVLLYIIPIIIAATIARRSALIATSILCTAAYVSTTVAYFVLNFNEGYKLELYGEISFYSALFIIIAALLWVFIRPIHLKKK
jgi:hypothetical protein